MTSNLFRHDSEATTGGFLQKKLFLKIHNIPRKTPVLESLFNEVAGLQVNLLKRDTRVFL